MSKINKNPAITLRNTDKALDAILELASERPRPYSDEIITYKPSSASQILRKMFAGNMERDADWTPFIGSKPKLYNVSPDEAIYKIRSADAMFHLGKLIDSNLDLTSNIEINEEPRSISALVNSGAAGSYNTRTKALGFNKIADMIGITSNQEDFPGFYKRGSLANEPEVNQYSEDFKYLQRAVDTVIHELTHANQYQNPTVWDKNTGFANEFMRTYKPSNRYISDPKYWWAPEEIGAREVADRGSAEVLGKNPMVFGSKDIPGYEFDPYTVEQAAQNLYNMFKR